MKRDASWHLRRYRERAVPCWNMRGILEEELNRLVNERSALNAEVDELRSSAPERLRGFDDATSSALQQLGELHFDLAFKDLQMAKSELAELRRSVEAAAELREVAKTVADLEDFLPPPLTTLVTPRILRRLRDLARGLLEQGEPRKTRFVILLLRHEVDLLQSRERGKAKASLEKGICRLESRDAEAVASIRGLLAQGFFILAERLVEDIEVDISLQDRFNRDAETPGGSLGPTKESFEASCQKAASLQASLVLWLHSAE